MALQSQKLKYAYDSFNRQVFLNTQVIFFIFPVTLVITILSQPVYDIWILKSAQKF